MMFLGEKGLGVHKHLGVTACTTPSFELLTWHPPPFTPSQTKESQIPQPLSQPLPSEPWGFGSQVLLVTQGSLGAGGDLVRVLLTPPPC